MRKELNESPFTLTRVNLFLSRQKKCPVKRSFRLEEMSVLGKSPPKGRIRLERVSG